MSMHSKKRVSLLLIAAALACVWGASRIRPEAESWARSLAAQPATPLEDAPPLMSLTVMAFGGFRGLVADVLWIRLIDLQKESRVFEIAQLSDWITRLEPHFAVVWAYHAWNMAYNISVLFPDPDDRWRWVQQGVRLLRDDGLRYNPRNATLYRELGWLYQHKIGDVMDVAHRHYKAAWAREMAGLLGGAHPPEAADPHDDRLRRMRQEYKLIPALMREVDAQLGPLDWRLPETHAVYWAWRGLKVAGDDEHKAACEQMLCQSMADAFRRGCLLTDPRSDLYLTTLKPDILPRTIKTFELALRNPRNKNTAQAYANFLTEAVVMLYLFQRDRAAREAFATLQALTGSPMTYDELITFCLRKAEEELPYKDAAAVVEAWLYRSYKATGDGKPDRASLCEQKARALWDTYMRQRPSEAQRLLTGLPPFPACQWAAWQRLDAELKGADARERFRALCPEPAQAHHAEP